MKSGGGTIKQGVWWSSPRKKKDLITIFCISKCFYHILSYYSILRKQYNYCPWLPSLPFLPNPSSILLLSIQACLYILRAEKETKKPPKRQRDSVQTTLWLLCEDCACFLVLLWLYFLLYPPIFWQELHMITTHFWILDLTLLTSFPSSCVFDQTWTVEILWDTRHSNNNNSGSAVWRKRKKKNIGEDNDDVRTRIRIQWNIRDWNLLCLAETLFTAQLSQESFFVFHMDRTEESCKSKGGEICLVTNNNWYNPRETNTLSYSCSPNLEHLISCRPCYLPWRFTLVIISTIHTTTSRYWHSIIGSVWCSTLAAVPRCCPHREARQTFKSSAKVLSTHKCLWRPQASGVEWSNTINKAINKAIKSSYLEACGSTVYKTDNMILFWMVSA